MKDLPSVKNRAVRILLERILVFENSSATMPYRGAVQTVLRFIAFHFKYAKLDTLKTEIPVLCALETPLKHQWKTLQPVTQHAMV